MKKPWMWFIPFSVLTACIVGLVVWIRVPSQPAPSTPQGPVDSPPLPVEFSASNHDFDLLPQRQGIDVVARAVGNRVESESQSVLGDSLLVERLGQAVSDRVRLMMKADIEAWAAEASRFSTPLDLDVIDPFFNNTLRERWTVAARGYQNIPVASGGISVRSIGVNDEPNLNPGVPGLVIRAAAGLASADYPQPPSNDPLIRAVEVLIPIKCRTEGSSRHDQPAMAALRLFWNSRMQEWQPYDLILYVDYSVSGKTVPFPYL